MQVTAKAERSGNWWAVEVPEIPGLFTQARRLDLVPSMVVEAASLLDVELEPDDVSVNPRLPEPDVSTLLQAARASAEARRVAAVAYDASREAVARLRGDGLSVRDVAMLMNLSPQRVSAIENEPKSAPGEAAAGVARSSRGLLITALAVGGVGRAVAEELVGTPRAGALEKVGPRGGAVEVRSVVGKDGGRVARKRSKTVSSSS